MGVVLNSIVLYMFYNERQSLTTSINTMTWYQQICVTPCTCTTLQPEHLVPRAVRAGHAVARQAAVLRTHANLQHPLLVTSVQGDGQ